MENYSYSSYPDSHDSSPRSREIDCENASWDEPSSNSNSNYKVKFMCSYGGKIHPRPHDNQLAYVGGETKILAVDRNIRFNSIISKLSSLSSDDVCFKYQLPGEDLDALISVTNDEDLEHMMLEYDRLHRAASKPARLRLFLFPIVNNNNSSSSSFDEQKTNQQWFVDALNSVPSIQSNLDSSSSSPPATASNPDFLFGFEKGGGGGGGAPGVGGGVHVVMPSTPPPPPPLHTQTPILVTAPPPPPKLQQHDPTTLDSDPSSQLKLEPPVVSIQRQIEELQRLQIANQEQQVMYQRKNEENLARAFAGDYYIQQQQQQQQQQHKPIPDKPIPTVAPTSYWQDRHMVTGGYSAPSTGPPDQQVYLVPSPSPAGGMYHHQMQMPPQPTTATTTTNVRQVTGQVGQGGYYGMQRMVPDVYREQPVYSVGPPAAAQVQVQSQAQPQVTKMMAPGGGGMQMGGGGGGGGAETTGYAQMGYDSAGRQVYYTTGAPPPVPTSYQAVTAVVSGGALNQEGKVVKPSPQASV